MRVAGYLNIIKGDRDSGKVGKHCRLMYSSSEQSWWSWEKTETRENKINHRHACLTVKSNTLHGQKLREPALISWTFIFQLIYTQLYLRQEIVSLSCYIWRLWEQWKHRTPWTHQSRRAHRGRSEYSGAQSQSQVVAEDSGELECTLRKFVQRTAAHFRLAHGNSCRFRDTLGSPVERDRVRGDRRNWPYTHDVRLLARRANNVARAGSSETATVRNSISSSNAGRSPMGTTGAPGYKRFGGKLRRGVKKIST